MNNTDVRWNMQIKRVHFFWRGSPLQRGPGRAQIWMFGQIYQVRHVLDLELTFWKISIMILHGFCWGGKNLVKTLEDNIFT